MNEAPRWFCNAVIRAFYAVAAKQMVDALVNDLRIEEEEKSS